MVPCALCDMQFKVALAEQDEIQLTVVGMALGLGEPPNVDKYKRKVVYRSQSKDQVRKSGILALERNSTFNLASYIYISLRPLGNFTFLFYNFLFPVPSTNSHQTQISTRVHV